MSRSPAEPLDILMTCDFDGVSSWINVFGDTPGPVSRGEFGVVGVRRLLELFRHFGAKATFFVPGHTALTYPTLLDEISCAGHEVAHHGWMHEAPRELSLSDERKALELGSEAIEKIVGIKPLGYRSPGWDLSRHTIDLLAEYGFEYDSSLMGQDYDPYWCRTDDLHDPSGGYRFGRPTTVVELPVSWHLDDGPLFEFVSTPTRGLLIPGLRTGQEFLQIWLSEYEYLHDVVGGGMLVLTLHPEVIGRGYRMLHLKAFLDAITARGPLRFRTCLDLAREWRARNGSAQLQ